MRSGEARCATMIACAVGVAGLAAGCTPLEEGTPPADAAGQDLAQFILDFARSVAAALIL